VRTTVFDALSPARAPAQTVGDDQRSAACVDAEYGGGVFVCLPEPRAAHGEKDGSARADERFGRLVPSFEGCGDSRGGTVHAKP
jgi:hypothetical protein